LLPVNDAGPMQQELGTARALCPEIEPDGPCGVFPAETSQFANGGRQMLEHLIALLAHPEAHACAWRDGELYIVPAESREAGAHAASARDEDGERSAAEEAANSAHSPNDDRGHASTGAYFTPSNSTSKMSVALGGMTPPAPRAP
jgi:hypothetical protein